MHPGPMNRGVEIASEVADRPNAVITEQVANGVAVRMAVLFMLLGSGRHLAQVHRGGPMTTAPDTVLRGGRTRRRDRRAPERRRSSPTVGSSRSARNSTATALIDAGGCIVAPGLVDLHTHLRQPGREEAETIETGARAAALGGYTAVLAMPNTTPPIDSAAVVREVLELGRAAPCDVHTTGRHHRGPSGGAAGADGRDGRARRADLHRRRHRRAGRPADASGAWSTPRASDVTLAQHCEVTSLSEGTCMHEGEWSARLGLPGQPSEAEELMVMRDIALARLTGARVHFQHMSTAGSVAMIAAAKAGGLPVTAEAAPHHFTLTDASCAGYDATFKVHPPLRADSDVDGDRRRARRRVCSTRSRPTTRPHTPEDKERPFDHAPPGMLGLEYALALAFTQLVDGGTAHDRGRRARPRCRGARRRSPAWSTTAGRSSSRRTRPTSASSTRRPLDDRRLRRAPRAAGTCPTSGDEVRGTGPTHLPVR